MKSYLKNYEITFMDVLNAINRWRYSGSGRKHFNLVQLDYNLPTDMCYEIYTEIKNRNLQTKPIKYELIYDYGSEKFRELGKECCKLQVMDYLLIWLLDPMINKHLGKFQCASIKGRGQTYAKKYISRWVKGKDFRYYVKLDAKKFYPSIDKEIIMGLLRKYVKSADVLYLAEYIIYCHKDGLNIGSYASQTLGNWLMSFAYHFAENNLYKFKRGEHHQLYNHQLYYMDDILYTSNRKADLKQVIRRMIKFFKDELHVTIKSNYKICQIENEPLHMCGYMFKPEAVTVKDKVHIRATRAFRRFKKRPSYTRAKRVVSYVGYYKKTDTNTIWAEYKLGAIKRKSQNIISCNKKKKAA